MKVLFANHRLEVRAGSELFTWELARAVKARGHEVAIFTFFRGATAEAIERDDGIRVFDAEDGADIAAFVPDIVHTHHLPCAHFLRVVAPDAVRVHGMLGALSPLEAPPLDGTAYALGLAVSEEVRDRALNTPFGRSVEIALFRNWFDDAAVRLAPDRLPGRPLRVAIVSNHIAPDIAQAVELLEDAGEIEADMFGLEWKSVVIDGALLTKYDAVVAIGRTALLAAACGVPCVMADIHGSDGLLTADNLDRVRTVNFSGRLSRQRSSAAHLRGEFAKLPGLDRRRLRARVSAGYSLQARVDWLLSRYDELLARHAVERPRSSPGMGVTTPVPSEGLVHAEMVAAVRKLQSSPYCRLKAWARANIVVLRRTRRAITLAMKRAVRGTRSAKTPSRLTNATRSAPHS